MNSPFITIAIKTHKKFVCCRMPLSIAHLYTSKLAPRYLFDLLF